MTAMVASSDVEVRLALAGREVGANAFEAPVAARKRRDVERRIAVDS